MTWVKATQKGEIPEQSGKEINVNGNKIPLFHANGKYYAIRSSLSSVKMVP